MGAISIDPFNSIISASIKFSDRKLFVSLGNFEAIVDPANSLTFFSLAAKIIYISQSLDLGLQKNFLPPFPKEHLFQRFQYQLLHNLRT